MPLLLKEILSRMAEFRLDPDQESLMELLKEVSTHMDSERLLEN